MIENDPLKPDSNSLSAEGFRNIPHPSEPFGNIPNPSESFRTVPNDSARFGNVPKAAERKAGHTLTVREAARLFESAGVARTERSIINWCQPNRQGVTRLDCYFDPNEHRYYLTPQSVERAIAEEQARATKSNDFSIPSEKLGEFPKASEGRDRGAGDEPSGGDVKSLRREILDLKITNRAKDIVIEQMQKERERHVEQLMANSRRVGELETRLLQLASPKAADSVESRTDSDVQTL